MPEKKPEESPKNPLQKKFLPTTDIPGCDDFTAAQVRTVYQQLNQGETGKISQTENALITVQKISGLDDLPHLENTEIEVAFRREILRLVETIQQHQQFNEFKLDENLFWFLFNVAREKGTYLNAILALLILKPVVIIPDICIIKILTEKEFAEYLERAQGNPRQNKN